MQVSGGLGTIGQSSGIVIGGGAALLLSNNAAQNVSRIGASAPINSYGGSFQYNNTAAAGVVYAQTAGPLTLDAGQTDVILGNDQSGSSGASQTLTFGGLAQSGPAVVTFSSPLNGSSGTTSSGVNATSNVVAIAGATQTTAGQIIGPWATVGLSNGQQRDYAVYNAAGQIVPAYIAGTTSDATWTNSSNAYTMGTALGTQTNISLTATRTIEALRDNGNSDTLNLGNYSLQTLGILDGGSNNSFTIQPNGGTGTVTTPSGGGNLYVTVGNDNNANIIITAPIVDNAGAVTLVKSGYNPLYLRGANSYTGGTVLNAGTTYVNGVNSLGSTTSPGTVTFAGGTLDNDNVAGLSFANPLVFNGAGTYNGQGNYSMTFTGAVSLGAAAGVSRQIGVNGAGGLVLAGVVSNGATANSIEKIGSGNLLLDAQNIYSGGTILSGGAVQMGVNPVGTVGNIASGAIGTGPIVFNGGGLVSSASMAVTVLNPVSFNGSSGNVNASLGAGGGGQLTFSGPINLGFASRLINVNGAAEFDGPVSGYGGTSGGGLVKGGGGLLAVTNSGNSYTGVTAVVGGTLRPTVLGAIPANTNLVVAGNIGLGTATLDLATNSIPLTIGYLTMGGPTVNDNGSAGNGWSAINTGAATLTLGGDVTYDTTTQAYTATINGNLALGTANLGQYNTGTSNYTGTASYSVRNFNVNDSSNAAPDMNVAAAVSGAAGLSKNSGGMLLLSGNNSYSGVTAVTGGSLFITGNNSTTGPTLVSGGGLVARSPNALGGNANTAGVTVFSGQGFAYNPTSDGQLAIGGNLSIMSTGTVIGTAIGGGTASAAIDVAGAATVSGTGSQTINIYSVPVLHRPRASTR